MVAPFVAALHGGIEQIRRSRRELVGTLRLGAPAEFGAHRLPAILAAFAARHPGVRFVLRLGHPSELVPLLEDGRLDLAFVDVIDPSGRMSGLEATPVMEEHLVLVGTSDLVTAQSRERSAFARLAPARFVDYATSAPAVRGWFRHHFGRAPARVDVVLAVESVQAVIHAVERGIGLGVVPAHAIASALAAGQLMPVATRRRPLTNQISLVRLSGKVPARLEREFVAHATTSLRRSE